MKVDDRARQRFLGVSIVAAFLLVLAACGEDESGGLSDGSDDTGASTSEEVEDMPDTIKVGFVKPLSGGGAPFGVRARTAAEMLVDEWNAEGGIAGAQIELVVLDGSAGDAATEYRRLVLDEGVDVVVGYSSSGNMLAIAPMAEELQAFTIIDNAGSPQLFEENPDLEYVFRTAGTAVLDGVGAARYVAETMPDIETAAGINQDYSWGRDSWADFELALTHFLPDVQVTTKLWPELFAGEYSSEITTILGSPPDVVHSSFWGGDLTGLLDQGAPRGLFDRSAFVLVGAEQMIQDVGMDMPEGVIVGARGVGTWLNPELEGNPLFDDFVAAYEAESGGELPDFSAFHTAQAFYGLRTAIETAVSEADGTWPGWDAVRDALRDSTFDSPSGEIRMDGPQAIVGSLFGVTAYTDEFDFAVLEDIRIFEPETVQPPTGVPAEEWIDEQTID